MSTRTLPGTDHLERFKRIVAARLGLHFDDAKLAFVGEVLTRLLDANGQTPHTYLTQLECGPSSADLTALARELTVGETYFFRNIDQFQACAQLVFPERMRANGADKRLRLLSAGCASGEEAFSLAIMARNIADASWTVSIRAVDINPDALAKASLGRFTRWALRETPPEIERSYFRQEGQEMVLDESIRRAVTLEKRNLASEDPDLWSPETFDVVFCRNMLMYFTPEHAQALVNRITRSLVPGGYLFLGHAETLRGLSQQFHLCHTHGTFYYQRKEGAEAAHTDLGRSRAASTLAPPTTSRFDVVDDIDSWVTGIQAAAERIQALTTKHAVPTSTAVAARARPDLRPALDLFRQERFSEALDVVHRLFPGSDDDPDVLLLHALLLAHSRQLGAAEQTCRRLLAIDELNAGAHYVLALCREGAGDRPGAAEHDQMAAYLDPLFAMPRLHLGLVARRAGDGETARRELRQAMLLLQREDPSRLLFFGGGFSRETLVALCRAELSACGGDQ